MSEWYGIGVYIYISDDHILCMYFGCQILLSNFQIYPIIIIISCQLFNIVLDIFKTIIMSNMLKSFDGIQKNKYLT